MTNDDKILMSIVENPNEMLSPEPKVNEIKNSNTKKKIIRKTKEGGLYHVTPSASAQAPASTSASFGYSREQ